MPAAARPTANQPIGGEDRPSRVVTTQSAGQGFAIDRQPTAIYLAIGLSPAIMDLERHQPFGRWTNAIYFGTEWVVFV